MKVAYWPVGAGPGSKSAIDLPVTLDEISEHLLADWLPSRPSGVAHSVFGWPTEMLEPHPSRKKSASPCWRVRHQAGGTERQWKGVVSWMLGVAGTRHVLAHEGYRWVAPLSAFYADQTVPVTLSGWHSSFSSNLLKAHKNPKSNSRLRPDYLAVRKVGGKFEWAAAESKGTTTALTNIGKCPDKWSEQSKNVILRMVGHKKPIPISRHLVVATRINSNAKPAGERRVAVRAWNSSDPDVPEIPSGAITEVVGAHLHGLFKNLGMSAASQAIADAIEDLAGPSPGDDPRPRTRNRDEVRGLAEEDLSKLVSASSARRARPVRVLQRRVESEIGTTVVEIDPALAELAREFIAADSAVQIERAIRVADERLDVWDESLNEQSTAGVRGRTSAGVSLILPEARFVR